MARANRPRAWRPPHGQAGQTSGPGRSNYTGPFLRRERQSGDSFNLFNRANLDEVFTVYGLPFLYQALPLTRDLRRSIIFSNRKTLREEACRNARRKMTTVKPVVSAGGNSFLLIRLR